MSINYTIVRQKRKTVSIQINDGEVFVKAPMRYPEKEIESFVQSKERWVNKNLIISRKKPCFSYEDGGTFPYLGEKYTVKVLERSLQEKVEIKDYEILVYSHFKKEKVVHNQKILQKWIKNRALEILTDRYDENFELFNYKSQPELLIKTFKSRWGAYHKRFLKDHITLNLNLIMYPLECIDYVIIHELAHKTQANHSKKFYALVEDKFPEWKQAKNKLDGKVD